MFRERSYQVRSATLTLQLPDSRLVIVNYERKADFTIEGDGDWYRSSRIPLTDKIEVEFKGDKAKLFWPVSLDGKKKKSETYNILGIIDAPEDNSSER